MTVGEDAVAPSLLTRGAILGDSLRRHWVPVLPADVLDRQQARRVRLLGEDLVCFRDLSGAYGLIGVRCPHRGVSLEWGFAAAVGVRCAYHGWCFDPTGRCIDIPLEGSQLREEISVPAYPLSECGGVLFAYLGDGAPPALPFDASKLDGRLRQIRFGVIEAKWHPVADGAVDPLQPAAGETNPFLAFEEGRPNVVSMRVPRDEDETLFIEHVCWEERRLGAAVRVVDSSEDELVDVGSATDPFKDRHSGPSWQLACALQPSDESGSAAGELLDRWLATGGEGGARRRAAEVEAGQCIDLLIGLQLPMWLRALGGDEPEEAVPEPRPEADLAGAQAGLVEADLERAQRHLAEKWNDVVRQPWSVAWPYAWSAASSSRWAEARDRAYASCWRTTWRDAADALELAGSAVLLRAAMTGDAADLDARCVTAFRACEIAARALRWPGAWSVAWAEAATTGDRRAAADGGAELERVATTIRRATLARLGAA